MTEQLYPPIHRGKILMDDFIGGGLGDVTSRGRVIGQHVVTPGLPGVWKSRVAEGFATQWIGALDDVGVPEYERRL